MDLTLNLTSKRIVALKFEQNKARESVSTNLHELFDVERTNPDDREHFCWWWVHSEVT